MIPSLTKRGKGRFFKSKMSNKVKTLFKPLILLCIFITLPSLSTADSVEYFYDDAGRLVRVLKGTEGINYQYDEVGNLISITNSAISNSPPVLQGITPDVFFIGSTIYVIISGQNLFTTKEVTSNSPFLSIKTIRVTDTEIQLEITVLNGASPEEVDIAVTTSFGSASIPVTLSSSRLIFSPGVLVLLPGGSGDITVGISPAMNRNLTIPINNSDTSVVSTPGFVTIPAGGAASFTVNGLKEGVATINSRTVVYVTDSSDLPAGEEIKINAGTVSIYIEQPSGSLTSASLPVSVYIQAPSGESIESLPVSVYIESPSGNSTTASLPVSVMIASGGTITGADTVSLPVSIRIEAPTADASIAALPVSIYIQTLSEVSATAVTNPVSIYIQTQTGGDVTLSSLVSVGKCPNQPVKVIGTASGYYASLQDAYNAASSGDIVRSHAGLLTGGLNINQSKTITTEGGYDCDFTTVIGKTSLQGPVRISNGTLKIGNFILKE